MFLKWWLYFTTSFSGVILFFCCVLVACGKRMKMCFTCKTEIKNKDGLSGEKSSCLVVDITCILYNSVEDDDESLCRICIERKFQIVFDCGHTACTICAEKVKECPFCRTPISRVIKIYN